MESRSQLIASCLAVACLVFLQVGCERRSIEVYTVKRETAVEAEASTVALRLPGQVPERWDPVDLGGGPRVASFRVLAADPGVEPADMGVTVFPGAAGGVLANVNRWRGEVQQPQVTQDELTDVLRVDDHVIHIVDAASIERRILGAILPLPGETWFFKLAGSKQVVTEQRDGFFEYLNALEIEGMDKPAAPTIEVSPDRPQITYEKPDGWLEGEPTTMRVASFTVAGGDNHEVEIAVIPLGNSGVSHLSIINQWRSTVGLDEATGDQLPGLVETVEISGREFQLVNFESPELDGGYRARIIVAYATVGEYTWFFKVSGESTLAAAQQAPLMEFLESVEFVAP